MTGLHDPPTVTTAPCLCGSLIVCTERCQIMRFRSTPHTLALQLSPSLSLSPPLIWVQRLCSSSRCVTSSCGAGMSGPLREQTSTSSTSSTSTPLTRLLSTFNIQYFDLQAPLLQVRGAELLLWYMDVRHGGT